MTIFDDRSRLLAACLALSLSICGCSSSDKKNREEQPVPALHHAPVVSATTPSGGVRLMDGMGNVDFAITTNSKEAQAFFNQGVAQLYGFWFVEAERSFQEAARLDPNAAMAYWGIAMAAPGTFLPAYQLALTPNSARPESRARTAILKAQALKDSITPREQMYIEAVGARHNSALGDPEVSYIAVMRRLVESFPDDLEA